MQKHIKRNIICTLAICSYIAGTCIGGGVLADKYHPSHLEILESLSAKNKGNSIRVEDFTDVSKNDWFYPYIAFLCEDVIVKGVSDTSFAPSKTFSFAESCAVITRYLGLETEAKQKQSILAQNSKAGHAEWYSGYIQLLYEMSILRSGTEFFTPDENGLCDIDTSVAVSPIKRYEFADMVSRSFELTQSKTKPRNGFFEISGNAREFIANGFYDNTAVSSYENVIKDFSDIPEAYRENVCKAYYNGLFCGNQFGQFLPGTNLTRGEMAKVIATVTDFSLRSWAENKDGIKQLSKSDFDTDASGNTYIKRASSGSILKSIAADITVQNGDISYIRKSTVPSGYSADIYVYSSHAGKPCSLIAENSLHNESKNGGKDIFAWFGDSGKVLIVLRNLAEGSRPEAVMEMVLNKSGVTETNLSEYKPVAFEKESNI